MARRQIQAGVMASSPHPFDSMALAMLLDLQKQIHRLQSRIAQLESGITTLSIPPDLPTSASPRETPAQTVDPV